MALLRYITHPNVQVDPAVPVPQWSLSDEGRRRAEIMARQPWAADLGRIVSSDETKAIDTAEILSAVGGVPVEVRDHTGENDRSATGFVPPDRFEELADAFFAHPDESVEGWERAADAQARVVAALADLLEPSTPTDIAVVGHGAVGTLWYCHLTGQAIDRRHDQGGGGGGNYFTVDLATGAVLHPWFPIDDPGA